MREEAKRGIPQKKPPQPAHSLKTVQQWLRDLRLVSAKQQNLFYKNRKEKFLWEQELLG